MSVQAYILIQTVGKAADVAQEIAKLPGVVDAEVIIGPYDIIVNAQAEDGEQLGKLVVEGVQHVDGIFRTITCQVVHL